MSRTSSIAHCNAQTPLTVIAESVRLSTLVLRFRHEHLIAACCESLGTWYSEEEGEAKVHQI